MTKQSLFDRENEFPVEEYDMSEVSTNPIDWIVRIRGVVNDSRLYPYPRNRKWAIQFQNPTSGKKKTLYIFENASWVEVSKEMAIRNIASHAEDGYQDFKEYYSGYTGDYTSEWEEYPRKEAKIYWNYCRNLHNACIAFFPENVMEELEAYA